MNDPSPVTLDVRDFPSNGSDGYTNTTASNNQVYSYKYGGGSDGAGNIVEQTGNAGARQIPLSLTGDSRYVIRNIVFSNDPYNQMSWNPQTTTQGYINDTDSTDEDAYYEVQVTDTTVQCWFQCDPQIRNKPA